MEAWSSAAVSAAPSGTHGSATCRCALLLCEGEVTGGRKAAAGQPGRGEMEKGRGAKESWRREREGRRQAPVGNRKREREVAGVAWLG